MQDIKRSTGRFFQWWAMVAGGVMGVTVSLYALAGAPYRPSWSSLAAWAYMSALAALLIVGMDAWRERKRLRRPSSPQSR